MLDEQRVDVRMVGATCNLVADDSVAAQAAIDFQAVYGGRTIFPSGPKFITRFNNNVNLTHMNMTVEGASRSDRGNKGGSQIQCFGCDGFIVGVPDSYDYATGQAGNTTGTTYIGPQGQTFRNLCISSMVRDTALSLTASTGLQYSAGRKGITDWRSGDIVLDNVFLEGFEYNFWGINSDVNYFTKVTSLYSKYGLYFGPRSDQNTLDEMYAFYCERAITADLVDQLVLNSPIIVGCGNPTTAAVEVRRGCGKVTLNHPWKEQVGSVSINGQVGAHLVSVGTVQGYDANDTAVSYVEVNGPLFYGTDLSLVYLGNGSCVVRDPTPYRGSGYNLITSIFYISSDQSWGSGGQARLEGVNLGALIGQNAARLLTNQGTGTPRISVQSTLSGNHWFASNYALKMTLSDMTGTAGANQLDISTGGVNGRISMATPTRATGQTIRFQRDRSEQSGTGPPTTGSWEVGDRIKNTVIASGSVSEWGCSVAGSPGTWLACGMFA